MDKNRQHAGIAKQPVRLQGRRRDVLDGRAFRYRNYGEALRAFASKLKAPEIRKKLLLVADDFSRKAASMEAKSRRVLAFRRT